MSLDSWLDIDPDEEMHRILAEYDGNPFAGSVIDYATLVDRLESTMSQHPELWWSRSLICSVCGFDEVKGWREGIGYFCRVHAEAKTQIRSEEERAEENGDSEAKSR